MGGLVTFPSAEEGLVLHRRLEAGDPTASADVCRAYLDVLLGWLEREYPRVDADLRASAAHDALLAYAQRPGGYRPEVGDLGLYLRMAARGKLSRLLRREGRARRLIFSIFDVELRREEGNLFGREQEPAVVMEREEEARERGAWLAEARRGLPPEEQRVLDLLLAGERRLRVFSEALGLQGEPLPEQEREVKRAKDRIKKRLRRRGA
jgi:hypothetical protein